MFLKKSLSILLLIVLFALMQIGIVTHEISHIQKPAGQGQTIAGQLVTSQQQNPQPDKSATHEHCAQCLAYAQVDGALPSIAIHVAMDASVFFISTAYVAYLLAVISRAYQARAPPSLI